LLLSSAVSTKLEVFTSFLFQESRKHGTDGQTDGRVQHLMQPLGTGVPHNNIAQCRPIQIESCHSI